jgi:hypothetical protein
VTVQTGAQALLVEEMRNKTDRSTQHEETVEDTHLKVVFGLLGAECAGVAEKVDKADSDTAVNIENEVVLFAGRDGLDSEGIVEQFSGGEVGETVLLDKRDTEIGVVARLDTVTDARN